MRLRKSVARAKVDQATQKQVGKLVNEITQRYLSEISKKLRSEIVKLVAAEWKEIATRKLTGSRSKYLQKYLSGMAPVRLEGNSIIIELNTADAVKIEAGWAPPQNPGSTIEDGIGTYDGTPKDLRPLLLHSGKSAKISHISSRRKKGVESVLSSDETHDIYPYKIIKFDLGSNQTEIENVVTDWLKAKAAASDSKMVLKKAKAANKAFKRGMTEAVEAAKKDRDKTRRKTGVSEGGATLPSEATRLLGNTSTVLWSETQQAATGEIRHRKHIFSKMRVHSSGRKVSFATYRTISDNPRQKEKWRAVGTPPANIISGDPNGDDLVHRIATILVDKGFERVLRSGTNLVPSYARTRVDITNSATMAASDRTPILPGSPVATTSRDPVVASMLSRSTPAAPAIAPQPMQPVAQASPLKTSSFEERVEAKAREMVARDYPKAIDQSWTKFGSMYMEDARRILSREKVTFSDKAIDNASVVEAQLMAQALSNKADKDRALSEKSGGYGGG